jgi:hypothetical protein
MMSAVPPAGKGTMTFTARRGYPCDKAPGDSIDCKATVRPTPRLRSAWRRDVINISSLARVCQQAAGFFAFFTGIEGSYLLHIWSSGFPDASIGSFDLW